MNRQVNAGAYVLFYETMTFFLIPLAHECIDSSLFRRFMNSRLTLSLGREKFPI